jgi:hypothetical protein
MVGEFLEDAHPPPRCAPVLQPNPLHLASNEPCHHIQAIANIHHVGQLSVGWGRNNAMNDFINAPIFSLTGACFLGFV